MHDTFLLLTVGSHSGLKGHKFVMDAFHRANIHDATLVIIGNQPDQGGCGRTCQIQASFFRYRPSDRRQHKRIVLLDPPRPDVVAAYQAADLFVFGSNIECSPLVLFESAAAGLPFITTPAGNAREIVDWTGGGAVTKGTSNRDGFVVGDLKDMVYHMEKLYRQGQERSRLGQRGHQAWLERFTMEGIARQYEQLYQKLIT